MASTWSGSWGDDCEDDLGVPPPTTEVTPPERRSYAQTTVLSPSADPVTIRVIEEPIYHRPPPPPRRKPQQPKPCSRVVRIATPRPDFPAPSHFKTESRPPRRSAPAKTPPQEIKCDKCHEGRGYLKFTERHVLSQTKDETNRLKEGVYCMVCVTAASPRCSKTGCTGKAIICLPDAAYPFGLFCNGCITAHRVSHCAA